MGGGPTPPQSAGGPGGVALNLLEIRDCGCPAEVLSSLGERGGGTMETNEQALRAVIFFDRGWWVAQCLDYDVCVSARSREKLPRKLLRRLQSRAVFDISHGLSPFQTVSKALETFLG